MHLIISLFRHPPTHFNCIINFCHLHYILPLAKGQSSHKWQIMYPNVAYGDSLHSECK
jgi:hypothetical protein